MTHTRTDPFPSLNLYDFVNGNEPDKMNFIEKPGVVYSQIGYENL